MSASGGRAWLTRRRLLLSSGGGVLGIAILGTAACSGSSGAAGGTATNTSAGSPTPATSTAGGATGSGTTGSAGAVTWKRVSLSFVSAYLLVRGREVAVVDVGTAGSDPAIGEALAAAGSGWEAVRHVVLTHRHADHVGGLAGVRPRVSATVYAGAADVAGISGGEPPLTAVQDGDEVFGLQIVETPGHTPGHVSVFDPATGVLVAGDALRTTDGLQGSDPRYTADSAAAAASVKKLAALPVRVILPGHGDPLTERAAEALQRLASTA